MMRDNMMKLKRFGDEGQYVLLEEVVMAMHDAFMTAAAFDAACNSPRNNAFDQASNREAVWDAVIDRDHDIGATIWNTFIEDNDLGHTWLPMELNR